MAAAVTGLAGAAGGLGGFLPPIQMGPVRDATGTYAIGFMLLSEVSLGSLIIKLLIVQHPATSHMTVKERASAHITVSWKGRSLVAAGRARPPAPGGVVGSRGLPASAL
jgi:hypothetical protein